MSHKVSAGLMMYRWNSGNLEVLLAHPGGPLYIAKDRGFWGIPKGQVESNETILAAAFREFIEETGLNPPVTTLLPLGGIIERSGKTIYAWAFQGDCDTTLPVNSNQFQMEWPPKSGELCYFPEIDRLTFFAVETAKIKIEAVQQHFIEQLEQHIYSLDCDRRAL